MTEQELEVILAQGYETHGIEIKGPGSRQDKPYAVKVVRAALGMVNRRDGGYVILAWNPTRFNPRDWTMPKRIRGWIMTLSPS